MVVRHFLLGNQFVEYYKHQRAFGLITEFNLGHNPILVKQYRTEEEMIAFTQGLNLCKDVSDFVEVDKSDFEYIENQLDET